LKKYADEAERVAEMLANAKKEHRARIEKQRQEMRQRIKQKLEEVIKKEEEEVENQKIKKKELEQTGITPSILENTITVQEEVNTKIVDKIQQQIKASSKSLDVFL